MTSSKWHICIVIGKYHTMLCKRLESLNLADPGANSPSIPREDYVWVNLFVLVLNIHSIIFQLYVYSSVSVGTFTLCSNHPTFHLNFFFISTSSSVPVVALFVFIKSDLYIRVLKKVSLLGYINFWNLYFLAQVFSMNFLRILYSFLCGLFLCFTRLSWHFRRMFLCYFLIILVQTCTVICRNFVFYSNLSLIIPKVFIDIHCYAVFWTTLWSRLDS